MKSHGFWVFLILFFCLQLQSQLLWVDQAWARDNSSSSSNDEYDFSWLDPDKKVYVLQNRKFRKSDRLMISVMPGIGLSEPYRETFNIEPRLAYYFGESWGVELFYTYFKASSNSASEALLQTIANGAIFPVIREYQQQYGGVLHWAPWYAKINVFNTILYFDWFFQFGYGQIGYEYDSNRTKGQTAVITSVNKSAFYLGTGHHYHLNQNWGIRLDLMGAFYKTQIFESSGDSTWYSNFNFSFGLGYRF